MTAPDVRRARLLAGTHIALAALLLFQPPHVLRRVAGEGGVPPTWIMRVLGARLALQAAPEAIGPSPNILRLGAAVDLAHGASMLVATRIWPRYRRAALASAGCAGASALASMLMITGRR